MATRIALLVITDGRLDYLKRSIPSALAMLMGPITHRFIFDDSGDPKYHRAIGSLFPSFELFSRRTRQGFGGAIRAAWQDIQGYEIDYIVHLEDDFIFDYPVPLNEMVHVLENRPHLQQMALRRQAWNETEKKVGGILEQDPLSFTDYSGQYDWLEHRRWFTTNPSLYRKELTSKGWPTGEHSEGEFTYQLLQDPAVQFGYWGRRSDPPWVIHIGDIRKGTGY